MDRYRIALLSDIHGNEVALRAVLRDLERSGVDEIACLGDVASLGPRPREALALVLEHCDYLVLGNHDEYMFAPEAVFEHSRAEVVLAAVEECREQLTPSEVDAMRAFAFRLELPQLPGGLLLFHGSPGSNHRDLVAETPDAELEQELSGHGGQVLAGGHTHVQLLRQHRGRLLVNPGSVGMPFERFVNGAAPTVMAHAEYAVVERDQAGVSVSLRRVKLDRNALIRDVGGWKAELAAFLLQQYRR